MADVYEQNLASKSTLTTTDYIRVVGSDNVSYKQLVSDVAKKIIENYTGSTLAGSAQSVKSAVDSLNSNSIIFKGTLSPTDDMDDVVTPGIYLIQGSLPVNGPSGFTWSPIVVIKANTTVKQIAVGSSAIATRNIGQSWYRYSGSIIS